MLGFHVIGDIQQNRSYLCYEAETLHQKICKSPKCIRSLFLHTNIGDTDGGLRSQSVITIHEQFTSPAPKQVLPSTGCMLFLLAPFEQRVAAVSKPTNICPICLAVPNIKLPNSQCKGRHAIRRRTDDKPNVLCMKKDCDYNHLVCQDHRELNKDHPFHQKLDIKVKDLHAKFPALKEANVAQEFTLLATSPEVPIYDADLSGISDPAKRALETIISTVQSLVDKSQHTNPINTTTIFSEHSDLTVHIQRHHADDGEIIQKPKNMKQEH